MSYCSASKEDTAAVEIICSFDLINLSYIYHSFLLPAKDELHCRNCTYNAMFQVTRKVIAKEPRRNQWLDVTNMAESHDRFIINPNRKLVMIFAVKIRSQFYS
jgi:hypothetical protein